MTIGWGDWQRSAVAPARQWHFSCVIAVATAVITLMTVSPDGRAQNAGVPNPYAYRETNREADRPRAPVSEQGAPSREEPARRERRARSAAVSEYHEVQAGETLFRIARRYGVTVEALERANEISDASSLRIGQRLSIPGGRNEQRERGESGPSSARAESWREPESGESRGFREAPPDSQRRRNPYQRYRETGDRQPRGSDLRRLAETMSEPAGSGRESEIPAGYIFFAQLIGADLKIGRMLSAWQDRDRRAQRMSAALDLDIIYGGGPDANPKRFYLPYVRTGPRLSQAGKRYALARKMPPAGNRFVTQLQAALIELHNRVVDLLIERHLASEKRRYCGNDDCSNAELARALPKGKRRLLFDDARETVIHYYHRVIVDDMLPRLIGHERTQDIITNGRELFFASGFRDGEEIKRPFIPYEFALAAYQVTASQVATRYVMREGERPRRLDAADLMERPERLRPRELADWRYFVDILPKPPSGFNRARPIDPYVASGARDWRRSDRTAKSAEAILIAGARAKLPSGQAVAEDILPRLRKRGLLYLWQPPQAGGEDREAIWQNYILRPDRPTRETVGRQTPLWYYVLQEAQAMGGSTGLGPTNRAYAVSSADGARYASAREPSAETVAGSRGGHTLGPVGGTILGEVLIGLAEHYALKTGKGLGFQPPIGASAYGESKRFTLTRVSAESGELGKRYLLRNLLIDAGVAVGLR